MVEVEMTKDIRDYETKHFGLITMRQMVCLLIGFAYAIPLFFLLPIEDMTTRIVIAAIAMMPVIIAGWVKIYGMRAEQFAIQVIKSTILTPSTLKYKCESGIDFVPKYQTTKDTAKKKKKIKKSPEYKAHK